MRANQQAGFTLIEAMVVVAIIAILASLAAPSFAKTLSEKRTQQAAADIVNAFSQVRSQAALSGKPAKLAFDSASKAFVAQYATQAGAETITSIYTMDSRIVMSSNIPGSIKILPTGKLIPTVENVYFRICDSGYSGEAGYTVWISPLGLTRQVSGKMKGLGNDAITDVNCA